MFERKVSSPLHFPFMFAPELLWFLALAMKISLFADFFSLSRWLLENGRQNDDSYAMLIQIQSLFDSFRVNPLPSFHEILLLLRHCSPSYPTSPLRLFLLDRVKPSTNSIVGYTPSQSFSQTFCKGWKEVDEKMFDPYDAHSFLSSLLLPRELLCHVLLTSSAFAGSAMKELSAYRRVSKAWRHVIDNSLGYLFDAEKRRRKEEKDEEERARKREPKAPRHLVRDISPYHLYRWERQHGLADGYASY